jgi:hypothetical protein
MIDPPSLKLSTTGILSGLSLPPFVLRMCPPLTLKNWNNYVPLCAIGASSGNVQVRLSCYVLVTIFVHL